MRAKALAISLHRSQVRGNSVQYRERQAIPEAAAPLPPDLLHYSQPALALAYCPPGAGSHVTMPDGGGGGGNGASSQPSPGSDDLDGFLRFSVPQAARVDFTHHVIDTHNPVRYLHFLIYLRQRLGVDCSTGLLSLSSVSICS